MRLARWLERGVPSYAVGLGGDDWFDAVELLADAEWALGTASGRERWTRVLDASSGAFVEALPLLQARVEAGDLNESWRRTSQAVLDGLLAPVWGNVTIFCASLNYHSHIKETGLEVPTRPQFFLKPSRCVIGPGDAVVLPSVSMKPDYEAELAVVIGKECKYVSEEDALDVVAGYTIVNDISFRDLQLPPDRPGVVDWVKGKALDTAAPTGPWVVTADAIPEPQDVRFRLWIGDDLRQDGHTSDMVFGVRRLISELSEGITLQPGDVIATGTCRGVGSRSGRFLAAGDELTIEIDGIGRLVHRIASERAGIAGRATREEIA